MKRKFYSLLVYSDAGTRSQVDKNRDDSYLCTLNNRRTVT